MNLIGSKNCANCQHSKVDQTGKDRYCHHSPPTAQVILDIDPLQGPRIIGKLSSFPKVEDSMSCSQHARLVVVSNSEPHPKDAA